MLVASDDMIVMTKSEMLTLTTSWIVDTLCNTLVCVNVDLGKDGSVMRAAPHSDNHLE